MLGDHSWDSATWHRKKPKSLIWWSSFSTFSLLLSYNIKIANMYGAFTACRSFLCLCVHAHRVDNRYLIFHYISLAIHLFTYVLTYCLFACTCTHLPQPVCGGQRATYRSWLQFWWWRSGCEPYKQGSLPTEPSHWPTHTLATPPLPQFVFWFWQQKQESLSWGLYD